MLPTCIDLYLKVLAAGANVANATAPSLGKQVEARMASMLGPRGQLPYVSLPTRPEGGMGLDALVPRAGPAGLYRMLSSIEESINFKSYVSPVQSHKVYSF